MDDKTLISQLRDRYPYLYDVEMAIRKVQANTGYGEVSVAIKVNKAKVYKASFLDSNDKLYRWRDDNRLT